MNLKKKKKTGGGGGGAERAAAKQRIPAPCIAPSGMHTVCIYTQRDKAIERAWVNPEERARARERERAAAKQKIPATRIAPQGAYIITCYIHTVHTHTHTERERERERERDRKRESSCKAKDFGYSHCTSRCVYNNMLYQTLREGLRGRARCVAPRASADAASAA